LLRRNNEYASIYVTLQHKLNNHTHIIFNVATVACKLKCQDPPRKSLGETQP